MIDVLVVGGGPAGLMAAIHAASAGLDVAVVERRRGPHDKACGEGLMPEALRRLRSVGVDPVGVDFHGIRYVDPRRSVAARFASGAGRGVRRTVLHQALLERCSELRIPITTAQVPTVEVRPDVVEAAGVRARYLVAADGLHSGIRAQLGLARPVGGPVRFGLRRHFRVPPWTDLVEVHWSARSEVYVTPVGDDLVGVAVLGGRPLSYDDELAAVPELGRRLAGSPAAGPLLGAGPLHQRTARRVHGRVLLVGDAAGYVDALTGEGLTLAFTCADAAIAAVAADDPSRYEADWNRLTRSYRMLTGGLLAAASHRSTRSQVVTGAAVMPWAFRWVVNSLAGDGVGTRRP